VKHLGIKLLPGQEVRISDQILPQLKQGKIIGLNTLF
jgi:protein-tyrosine phosphatase